MAVMTKVQALERCQKKRLLSGWLGSCARNWRSAAFQLVCCAIQMLIWLWSAGLKLPTNSAQECTWRFMLAGLEEAFASILHFWRTHSSHWPDDSCPGKALSQVR